MLSDVLEHSLLRSGKPIFSQPFETLLCASDYRLLSSEQIGVCQIQGYRQYQEDYLVYSKEAVQAFSELTLFAQEIALKYTFDQLQEKYGQSMREGSTGCVAIVRMSEGNQVCVTTANLGDSLAYLIILQDDDIVFSHLLNKLHKPTVESELRRIRAFGGFVSEDGRLNGNLALSRAFGDKRHENQGISHEPEITRYFCQLDEGHYQIFVVVASDGLEVLSSHAVGKIVHAYGAMSPDIIANALVDTALQKKSKDNISVAVIPVGHETLSAAIFDGHGGHSVSQHIANHFYQCLKRSIENALTPDGLEGMKLSLQLIPAFLEAVQEEVNQCIAVRDGCAVERQTLREVAYSAHLDTLKDVLEKYVAQMPTLDFVKMHVAIDMRYWTCVLLIKIEKMYAAFGDHIRHIARCYYGVSTVKRETEDEIVCEVRFMGCQSHPASIDHCMMGIRSCMERMRSDPKYILSHPVVGAGLFAPLKSSSLKPLDEKERYRHCDSICQPF